MIVSLPGTVLEFIMIKQSGVLLVEVFFIGICHFVMFKVEFHSTIAFGKTFIKENQLLIRTNIS